MKEKRMSVSRKQNCRWLFPVLLLAFLTGIVIPVKAYVQGYAQFSIRPVQILPTIATCFIVILALGTGIGLLILNWQRVKQRLGDYWLLAIGAFVALVFIVFAQNRLPGPALLPSLAPEQDPRPQRQNLPRGQRHCSELSLQHSPLLPTPFRPCPPSPRSRTMRKSPSRQTGEGAPQRQRAAGNGLQAQSNPPVETAGHKALLNYTCSRGRVPCPLSYFR